MRLEHIWKSRFNGPYDSGMAMSCALNIEGDSSGYCAKFARSQSNVEAGIVGKVCATADTLKDLDDELARLSEETPVLRGSTLKTIGQTQREYERERRRHAQLMDMGAGYRD